MKKIVLLCSAGMSTSMLVKKMQAEADSSGYAAEIAAYPLNEAEKVTKDADIVLLGPQVRFSLKKIKDICPNIPVETIDMMSYGKMDGKKVLDAAKKAMGE